MKLGLPIWSDRHRLHEPGGEVWIGARTPGTEVPRRAEAIRDAVCGCEAPFVPAAPHLDAGSVHVDRGAGSLLCFAREAAAEHGSGVYRNVPLAPGGCDLTTIGALVAETLARVQEGATRA